MTKKSIDIEDIDGLIKNIGGTMSKELTKGIQGIINSLGSDGIVFLPPGVYSVVGLIIPLGVWVYGI